MAGAGHENVFVNRKFESETEIEEKRKKRQEEWEKVRKPEDPEECPEEVYDPRSLFDRLQEQKDKKQQEYEEQFKFKNMVKCLDEDETNFLDEVSRQQMLVEKQRRDEDLKELNDSDTSDSVKKQKLETNKDSSHRGSETAGRFSGAGSVVHRPSVAVCVGILPGLGAYSGSSDSDSSTDSEGTIISAGSIISSVLHSDR
ncbi:PSME3-interacting protein isoform X3 [Polyodon spathula]|uniref:PSME3-interacting protein isoform X3 n=1 Tax=Polyodon spathula TaxID=7913 RepID=UPI001B7ECFD1|nr:PSME3-interacting protein isoform X3 [Polyodon spathula]